MRVYRVATRRSALAMAQTRWVVAELAKLDEEARFEIVAMVTRGDMIQDVALSKVGGKGLFVNELEQALLDKRVDMAVHSLKDVPAALADGLVIGAIPKREDPRDALILHQPGGWSNLPHGAIVGTSSLRRQAQLRASRPDLRFEALRGNIDTRLGRVMRREMDAIILAAAGLNRLGLAHHVSAMLAPELCLPSIGQGALGIECREDDDLRELLNRFTDAPTALAVAAERELLAQLNGGCQVPIAGYATVEADGRVHLRGYVAALSGDGSWSAEAIGHHPTELGRDVANQLLESGAKWSLDSSAFP